MLGCQIKNGCFAYPPFPQVRGKGGALGFGRVGEADALRSVRLIVRLIPDLVGEGEAANLDDRLVGRGVDTEGLYAGDCGVAGGGDVGD
jgi:hypothetical protein